VLPDYSKLFANLPVLPDYSKLFANLPVLPDYSKLFANLPALPDYSKLLANLPALPDYSKLLANLPTFSDFSMRALNVTAHSVAERFVAEVVDEEIRAQDWWRDAADQWITEHAFALLWWMVGGVVVVLFYMAAMTDPALVDSVNRALATPIGLAALALAVWALRRPKE
jgi:hypothetical protein